MGEHIICTRIPDYLPDLLLQGRKAEEQRSQRLASELGQFRHEAERRLQEKDEEIESIRLVNKSTFLLFAFPIDYTFFELILI